MSAGDARDGSSPTTDAPPQRRTLRSVLAAALVIAGSVAYCYPGHPSFGGHALLDALAHAGVFLVAGLWTGRRAGGRVRWFSGLAALALLLEVLQWRIGGYARVEWVDVAANEAGLAAAWLRTRSGRMSSGIRPTAKKGETR